MSLAAIFAIFSSAWHALASLVRQVSGYWRLMFALKLANPTESDDQHVPWRLSDGITVYAASRYIRVTLKAPKWLQVEDCIVSVRRITVNGGVLSTSSSTLAWR